MQKQKESPVDQRSSLRISYSHPWRHPYQIKRDSQVPRVIIQIMILIHNVTVTKNIYANIVKLIWTYNLHIKLIREGKHLYGTYQHPVGERPTTHRGEKQHTVNSP